MTDFQLAHASVDYQHCHSDPSVEQKPNAKCFCTLSLECPSHLCEPPRYEPFWRRNMEEECRNKPLEAFPEITDVDSSLDYRTPIEIAVVRRITGMHVNGGPDLEQLMQSERRLAENIRKCFPDQVLPPVLNWPPLWISVARTEALPDVLFPSSPRLSHAEAVLATKWDVLADRERVNETNDEDEEEKFGDTEYKIGRLTPDNFHRLIVRNQHNETDGLHIGSRHRFEVKVRRLQLAEHWRRSHASRTNIVLKNCIVLHSEEVRRIVLDFLIGPDWQQISQKVWIDGRLESREPDA
eukprot:CAMPEP_0180419932 /NCGR_PEP_ID=MMETSP1036_2-20121128/2371_1 /TAXON_ID=632150 /ORGANISM="Azadinium spinosum, Strain 3D9" /LENGTH=295 /DNA_ID=CAMNT_0022425143 /DNA_START=90 /DNA_END=977 /DNA_ORIENTATION=+